jgi:putative PIN family toxin of toxin-antitoxin system
VPRVVFDPNVLVSALISLRGAPAALYLALTQGRFELVVSPALLAELERVLLRSKFRRYASVEQARAFVDAVARLSTVVDDEAHASGLTPDPGDDYLVALAPAAHADAVVSGDKHLLSLSEPTPPVITPHGFREQLGVRTTTDDG